MFPLVSVAQVSAVALTLGVGAVLASGLGVAHADAPDKTNELSGARAVSTGGPERTTSRDSAPMGSPRAREVTHAPNGARRFLAGAVPGQELRINPGQANDPDPLHRTPAPPTVSVQLAGDESQATAMGEDIPYASWATEKQLFTGSSTIINTLLTAVIPLFRGAPSSTGPELFTPTPPWFTTIGVTARDEVLHDMTVWTIRPVLPSGKQVVAIHGGGYVNEPSLLHWLTYSAMAARTRATVVVPLYPVIPQGGTAAQVVPQMSDFLADMISRYGATKVSVLGDSAGGGLALAATQELVRRGQITPAHLVLLSPWLDITLSDPAILQINDPIASPLIADLSSTARFWVGDLPRNHPWTSPLYGSLDGLSTVTVYSGSRDLTAPDVLRLKRLALDSQADISFVLRADALHDWPLYAPLPDAALTIGSVYRHLGIVSDSPRPRTGSRLR